jgi:hypothetical protein
VIELIGFIILLPLALWLLQFVIDFVLGAMGFVLGIAINVVMFVFETCGILLDKVTGSND